MSKKEKKTEEMEKYEEETGKQAIWLGRITDGFKKWQKGEKVYIKDKGRINILISEEKKILWQEIANKYNISTISKFIRNSVDFFIRTKPKIEELSKFSESIHSLKEELSSIKGF